MSLKSKLRKVNNGLVSRVKKPRVRKTFSVFLSQRGKKKFYDTYEEEEMGF